MKKSIKAPLFSAFLFPGSGHLYLKQYIKGITLGFLSLLGLFILLSHIIEITHGITLQIQQGALPLDIEQIRAALLQALEKKETFWVLISYPLIGITWLFGVIDSYRLAKKTEINDEKNETQ